MKCILLPRDIDDDLVFALLGEYHIIGKKDWVPFEQAGYLWRRCKKFNVAPSKIGLEMGLSVKKINKLINVYQFMVDHKEEDPQRWSYYEEYLKHRKVQERREQYPSLDDAIVRKIKSGEIPKAVDVRDKVTRIVAVGGKTLDKFIDNDDVLESCYNAADARGANNRLLKNIEKFKTLITDPDSKREILKMPDNQKKKCRFALDKIQKAAEKINKII